VDPLTALLGSPLVGDIGRFRRGLKLAGILRPQGGAHRNLAELGQRRVVSSVWAGAEVDDAADRLAASLSKQFRAEKATFEAQARRIAEDVQRFKKEREEEEEERVRMLEDTQEMEVSKSRAHKLAALTNAREAKKADAAVGAALRKKRADDDVALARREAAAKKAVQKRREDENTLEVARVQGLRRVEEGRSKHEEVERRQRHFEELMKLKDMADSKEWEEILRRAREEARMKYLEERRRYIEQKQWDSQHGAREDLERRRRAFVEDRKKVQARVRAGNFMRHSGQLGFYDDVRAAPVEWIQYEDASGTPYYYDPLLNKTTYELPTDAPVRHYTVDERIAYDAEHGEGAYDLNKWNERNKQSIMDYGGYYDESGEWIEVNGVYGEDGTFYNLSIGYFDEWGRYILRPIIQEKLDFMV